MRGFEIALLVFIGCGLSVSCSREQQSAQNRTIQRVNDKPDYQQDREVEDYSSSRTNSHGASGPGSGSSYSSTGYRGPALKSMDKNKETVGEPGDRSGRNDLSADTLDTGKSW